MSHSKRVKDVEKNIEKKGKWINDQEKKKKRIRKENEEKKKIFDSDPIYMVYCGFHYPEQTYPRICDSSSNEKHKQLRDDFILYIEEGKRPEGCFFQDELYTIQGGSIYDIEEIKAVMFLQNEREKNNIIYKHHSCEVGKRSLWFGPLAKMAYLVNDPLRQKKNDSKELVDFTEPVDPNEVASRYIYDGTRSDIRRQHVLHFLINYNNVEAYAFFKNELYLALCITYGIDDFENENIFNDLSG